MVQLAFVAARIILHAHIPLHKLSRFIGLYIAPVEFLNQPRPRPPYRAVPPSHDRDDAL